MSRRKINRGMFLGFTSYGTDAIVSTLLFPLLIRYLGRSEAGAWMLFNSIGAMFACLLSGAGPVVARATAQTLAGGEGVYTWGQLRHAAGRLYAQISFVCLGAGIAVSFLYLPSVSDRAGISTQVVLIAWGVFMFGWTFRAFTGLRFSYLDGIGEIGFNRALGTATGLLNLLLVWGVLSLGGGLGGLCIIYTGLAILLWASAGGLLRSKMPKRFWGQTEPTRTTLMADGLRMFVLSMTSYVTTQSCIIFVERSSGTETLATFAPVVRLSVLMSGAACLPATLLFPYLSRRHQEQDKKGFRRMALAVMFLPPILYSIPGCALLIFPREIIGAWLGHDHYAGDQVVRLVVLYGFLFALQSAAATPAVAIKARSFLREASINIVLVLILMPTFAQWWGLAGYPLGMLVGALIPFGMVLSQSIRLLAHYPVNKPPQSPSL
jgi:O-antigen/teichoic acid export membrane protein